MNVLRKLGLAFLAAVLLFALLGTAWSDIGRATLGDRDTVKGWLDESRFYDRVVTAVLEQANKEASKGGEMQIPVDDPQIQAIVSSAFSPDYLKQNVEKVLDGTYAWLEGATDKPEFTIDITEAKQRLADGIGNYATTKAASLPACTPAQTAELANSGSFDILSAPCLPPGTDVSAATAELRNQILSNEDFLSDTSFSGDDLKVTSDGQEVALNQAAEFKRLQDGYKLATFAPYIFAAVALLAAIGIVFLSPTKRQGISRVGVITLVGGILLGISFMVFDQGAAAMDKWAAKIGGESATSKALASDLVGAITADISSLLMWYAIGFTAVGIIMVLVAKFVGKPKAPDLHQSADPEPPIDDSPKADPVKTSTSASIRTISDKPDRKPPRKIQL